MERTETRLLPLAEVLRRTTLGKTALYQRIQAGAFPRPVRLGGRRVAWVAGEVESWIAGRAAERDAVAS